MRSALRCEANPRLPPPPPPAEHAPARFGGGDSLSSALFSLTDHLGPDLAVSLFLRTRRPTGLLLAIAPGDEGGGGDAASEGPYLRVWLEGGKVRVQVNGSERLESRSVLSDGEVHFVSVEVGGAGGGVMLFVGEEQQGHAPQGRPLDVRAGDRVSVGGLQEEGPGSAFKGCLQDLRINGRRLQFSSVLGASSVRSFPLEDMVNVSEGCPGDDACLVSGDRLAEILKSLLDQRDAFWSFDLMPSRRSLKPIYVDALESLLEIPSGASCPLREPF